MVDPGDGLPVRTVSEWNDRKHHFLRRYMEIFAVGMRKRWNERGYVDLFAGPGRIYNEDAGRFDDGSPLIALARDFTRYVFVEKERRAAAALRDRVAAHPRGDRAVVLEGDCNDVIREVGRSLPSDGLTFAFIDPTSWQVAFETMRILTRRRRVDILLTFHIGGMRRVADREQPRLDAFFGTPDWRPFLGARLKASELLGVYRRQMASLGYVAVDDTPAIPVKNREGALMYYLVFFSKNERGYDFWRKIAAVDESGQPRLPL